MMLEFALIGCNKMQRPQKHPIRRLVRIELRLNEDKGLPDVSCYWLTKTNREFLSIISSLCTSASPGIKTIKCILIFN